MDFEELEPVVDGLGESELADERLDGADAAVRDRAGLGGDLVLDVGRGDDRVRRGLVTGRLNRRGFCVCLRRDVGVEWFSLEISFWVRPWDLCRSIQCATNAGRFRVFVRHSGDSRCGPRLVKD